MLPVRLAVVPPTPHRVTRVPVFAGRQVLKAPVPADFAEFTHAGPPCGLQNLPPLPLFFLHGTSTDGTSLDRVVTTFKTHGSGQPIYRSYLPEVQEGTGIQKAMTDRARPSFLMADRDLGDFRYQMVHRNIARLRQALADAPDAKSENQAIADFFDVPVEHRKTLLPVLRALVFKHILGGSEESLEGLAAPVIRALRTEADRLAPRAKQPEILDTHWFYMQGQAQDRTLDWHQAGLKNAVNPRVITLADIGRLEARLLELEAVLADALQPVLGDGHPGIRATAAGLMAKIVPPALAFGHSQGGVVLLYSLLQGLAKTPQADDPDGNAELAGRGIGMCLPLASPVGGMKDIPDALRDLFQLLPNDAIRHFYAQTLWEVGKSQYAAAPEVRQGSGLMQAIRQWLPQKTSGHTVVSLYDKRDLRVEADTAELPATGPNLFNHAVELPMIPNQHLQRAEFQDAVRQEYDETLNRWFMIPSPMAMMLSFNPFWNAMKDVGLTWFRKFREETRQHWAPVVYSQQMFCDSLGGEFFNEPARLIRLMALDNAEAVRAQAIRNLSRHIERRVFTHRSSEVQQAMLTAFEEEAPGFMARLAENAAEGTLLAGSAADEARRLLARLRPLKTG